MTPGADDLRCPGTAHRHGCYERYADPQGTQKESVQRYLCPPCGLTFSVLLAHRLPYRPIRAERLQGDFDQRAGIQSLATGRGRRTDG